MPIEKDNLVNFENFIYAFPLLRVVMAATITGLKLCHAVQQSYSSAGPTPRWDQARS